MRCSKQCRGQRGFPARCRKGRSVLRTGLTLLAMAALASAAPARADEQGTGHYQPGTFSFLAGVIPSDAGFYFTNFQNFYEGSVGANIALPIAGRLRLGIKSFAFIDALAPMNIYKSKILGAQAGSVAIIPFVYLDNNTGAAAGSTLRVQSQQNFNLGDMYIAPLMLGWTKDDIHVALYPGVFAPTGEWRSGQLSPTGKNYWTFEAAVGFTYLNPKSGWEFSTFQAIDFNTTNEATDYKSGDDFHIDWVVAKHLARPVVTTEMAKAMKEAQAAAAARAKGAEAAPPAAAEPPAGDEGKSAAAPADQKPPKPVLMDVAPGIGGYWYRQVTGDSGAGAVLGPFEGRAVALGPELQATANIANRPMTFQFKILKEFLTEHRLQGLNTWANVNFKF